MDQINGHMESWFYNLETASTRSSQRIPRY